MRLAHTLAILPFLLAACGGGDDAPPADDAAPAPAPVTAASSGATTYQQVCVSCHQDNGMGIPPSFPPLAGSAILTGDAAKPIAIVLHGMQGEIVREGTTYNGVMSAWGSLLSDEEVANVLTYARSSFGNTASAVTAAEVAAVRAATASQSGGWTEATLNAAKLN